MKAGARKMRNAYICDLSKMYLSWHAWKAVQYLKILTFAIAVNEQYNGTGLLATRSAGSVFSDSSCDKPHTKNASFLSNKGKRPVSICGIAVEREAELIPCGSWMIYMTLLCVTQPFLI